MTLPFIHLKESHRKLVEAPGQEGRKMRAGGEPKVLLGHLAVGQSYKPKDRYFGFLSKSEKSKSETWVVSPKTL